MKHHVKANAFVASGTKQLRVICALYDNDMFSRKSVSTDCLKRSASVMRKQVVPALSRKQSRVDEHIRLIIDTSGPSYVHVRKLARTIHARRVGNFYYTHAFAEWTFKNVMLSHASFRDTAAKGIMECQCSDSELASLMPNPRRDFWWNAAEDIFFSPHVLQMEKQLMAQCSEHGEFAYISIDGTVKCCLSLLGQATYRHSKAARAEQDVTDGEATYKVLTVRGRTSAVLMIAAIQSEAGHYVSLLLESKLTDGQREQVQHIACDNPSESLFLALKQKCINLKSLGLDACHLVMMYEQTQWHKKTEGSRWVRIIMAKFAKHDAARDAADWGEVYTGAADLVVTGEERRWREALNRQDISKALAKRILERMDPETPWLTRIGYMESIGAVCSLYPDEVSKTTATGKSLRHVLLNSATAAKVEWLMNDTRYRHRIPRKQLKLLPSGTTSNESLHHELNVWFRETQQMHRPTLDLKIHVFKVAKLLAHNHALYASSQRQMSSKDVLHRVLGAMSVWTAASWAQWCKKLRVKGGPMMKSVLPMAEHKKALAAAVKARKKPASHILRRPASALPMASRSASGVASRRTAFTLRRLRPVRRVRQNKQYVDFVLSALDWMQ